MDGDSSVAVSIIINDQLGYRESEINFRPVERRREEKVMVVSLFSSFFVVTTAGQSMPASDRDPEGRRLVGHGVVAALHVPRRGARRSGTARRVPKNGADASGSRVGRCEQRRCQNSSSLVLRREQWQCAGKYEFQLSRLQATDLNLDIVRGNWTLDFRT